MLLMLWANLKYLITHIQHLCLPDLHCFCHNFRKKKFQSFWLIMFVVCLICSIKTTPQSNSNTTYAMNLNWIQYKLLTDNQTLKVDGKTITYDIEKSLIGTLLLLSLQLLPYHAYVICLQQYQCDKLST